MLAPQGLPLDSLMTALEAGYARMGDVLKKPRLRRRYLVVVAGGAQAARALTERISGVESLAAISDAEVQETGSAKRVSEVVSQRLVVVWPPFSALDADGQQRVVTHELTHAALAGVTSGRTPSWLIEGIALYVSEDRRSGDAARYLAGEASGRARRALSLRALSEPDAIARLSGDGQAVAYAYASAASFYIADRFGRKRFIKLYNAFNDEDLPGHAGARHHAPRDPPHARDLARPARHRSPHRPARLRRSRASDAVPELPEVETIRRHLAPHVDGRTLRSLEIHDARWTLPLAPPEVATAVAGRRVEKLGRRGKYLVWELEDDVYLMLHLRMTGTLLLDPPERPPHTRVTFDLGEHTLEFVDPRRFGTGELALGPEALDDFFAKRLGVEPFDAEFTGEHLYELTQHSRAPIKAMLLDQKRIAGVGNIYADEALFRARIHPLRLANRINRKQAAALRDAIVETLELGHRVQGRHDRRLPRPGRGQRLVPGPLPDPPARGRAVRALRPARAEAASGGAGDLRVRELPAAPAARRPRPGPRADRRGRP